MHGVHILFGQFQKKIGNLRTFSTTFVLLLRFSFFILLRCSSIASCIPFRHQKGPIHPLIALVYEKYKITKGKP